jgi:hypothetical protein
MEAESISSKKKNIIIGKTKAVRSPFPALKTESLVN